MKEKILSRGWYWIYVTFDSKSFRGVLIDAAKMLDTKTINAISVWNVKEGMEYIVIRNFPAYIVINDRSKRFEWSILIWFPRSHLMKFIVYESDSCFWEKTKEISIYELIYKKLMEVRESE